MDETPEKKTLKTGKHNNSVSEENIPIKVI